MSEWYPIQEGFLMQFPCYAIAAAPFYFDPETHKWDHERPSNYIILRTDRGPAVLVFTDMVADAHQPCHAGSLYMEGAFARDDGDRGANSIPTRQRRNMHALWDRLLGDEFSWTRKASNRRNQIRQLNPKHGLGSGLHGTGTGSSTVA